MTTIPYDHKEQAFIIKDAGRQADALEAEYAPYRHPVEAFGFDAWIEAQNMSDTQERYWVWVERQLILASKSLGRHLVPVRSTPEVTLVVDAPMEWAEWREGDIAFHLMATRASRQDPGLPTAGDAERAFVSLCESTGTTALRVKYNNKVAETIATRIREPHESVDGRTISVELAPDEIVFSVIRQGKEISGSESGMEIKAFVVCPFYEFWVFAIEVRFENQSGVARIHLTQNEFRNQ